jgi:hypothetical protein
MNYSKRRAFVVVENNAINNEPIRPMTVGAIRDSSPKFEDLMKRSQAD